VACSSNWKSAPSKAGLIGLTVDLAVELAPFNVCVNRILPGATRTAIGNGLQSVVDMDAFFEYVGKSGGPLGRVGMPEDVGNLTLSLSSDLSSYVTGARIYVGGGFLLVVQRKAPNKH
jgi:3-oxoacyl-[acyl-carrier protein] reductase